MPIMIRSFAFSFAIVALAAISMPIAAQNSADVAAEAAQLVAARADIAFERIDPDLDPGPVIEFSAPDDAAASYPVLPPPPQVEAASLAPPEPVIEALRDPAVRMIASEVVQPLPRPAARVSNDPFVIKSILPIEGSIRYGDWFWDESTAPAAGKLVVTVDLEARVISAFRDGHEIGTAVALLGTQSHPTPLGTFPILTKEKDNVSEKYNNAPMPHTLRLTWDGIAIHGSPVMNGYASHGCIGVPDEFAAKLFAAAKRGDKVIITRGKMVGVGDKVL